MNWIDACKSGRWFKRRQWANSEAIFFDGKELIDLRRSMPRHVHVTHTLCEDFEFVEDEPLEVRDEV